MALKRQQAAEDAIAMGLAAVATGNQFEYLPPGPIFGMKITDPQGNFDPAKFLFFMTIFQITCHSLADEMNTNKASRKNKTPIVPGSEPTDDTDKEESNEPEPQMEEVQIMSENQEVPVGCGPTNEIPTTALEMLSKLFPEKKKSVLELVLRRCGDDLLKAIEQCNPLREGMNCFGYDCGKRHGKGSTEKPKNCPIGKFSTFAN